MKDIRVLMKQRRDFYKKISFVFCPVLNENIYFTSNGFNHLLYESNRKPRKLSERCLKLECLKYAPKVLRQSQIQPTVRQVNRIVKGVVKAVFQYGVTYEVQSGRTMRVIIEKVGNGKMTFLSVMPHDKKSKTKKRPKGRS